MEAISYPVCRDHKGFFPLGKLAERSAEEFGPYPVFRTWNGSGYDEILYKDFADDVYAVGRWLVDSGVKPGDHVAVLGPDNPRWIIAYLGILSAGGIVIPVDRLLGDSGIRHVISHSETTVLFTSAEFLDRLAEMEPLKMIRLIILMDNESRTSTVTWSDVLQKGMKSNAVLPERSLDDTAAVLYTSGTTGHSKGVVLSNLNIISNVAHSSQLLPLGHTDVFLSMLPLHHSFALTAGILYPIYCGCSITFARSLKSTDLLADIRETQVSAMGSVPLLFEKMHAGMLRMVKKRGFVATTLFKALLGLARVGEMFGFRWGTVLFKSMRDKAGLGSVKYFVTGGGPLDPNTSRFFLRFGIPLLQGFGLTETSPITHTTPPSIIRHECVGLPMPEVEARIDNPDSTGVGELCIKGPNVFQGYYKNDKATSEVFDDEGWFHTGDLGIIHPDGFLQITGRKKNLLVTAGGKNVFPEEIEYRLNRQPFIGESLVLGMKRSSGYGDQVSALIHPDYEQLDLHFEEQSDEPTDEDVYNLIAEDIREAQKDLPKYKHIRYFRIFEEEFQKTSTRKIKRYLYSAERVDVEGVRV